MGRYPSDASHFVGELVGRFEHERHGLPAISLTADSVNLTAIGNDYGYENVFARQVEALANKKDIVLGISTSGTSKNVIKALEIAPENTLKILLTSERIGSFEKKLETKVDYIIKVPSSSTARIQEVHIMVLHVLAMLIEQRAG
jgi:D-sedoheptulose 7-phosphate isomerase